MARSAISAFLILAAFLGMALAQEQILLQNARQKNLVDVQFFADTNYQQIRTPFSYSDFPAITAGSCTQCVNFPDAPIVWGSAVVAYSPTGGEILEIYRAAGCAGEPLTTGANAPSLPTDFGASSFKVCRN